MRGFGFGLLAAMALLVAACADGGGGGDQQQSSGGTAPPPGQAAGNTLLMELKTGVVTIELRPDLAPQHVARIKQLTSQGFYNGIIFHRVIEGFMAQTGDPTGTGRGGSELADLPAEFTNTPFVRGTLGMARAASPNSANSQFFITFADARFLDGQYTVFGSVTGGMEHVDQITRGEPPANPDKIISLKIAGNGAGTGS
jgi:cyclophilin family peptidyl-prolyl cis-trans isomerase